MSFSCWKESTDNPREESITADSKEEPIPDDPKENPINGKPKEGPITVKPKGNPISEILWSFRILRWFLRGKKALFGFLFIVYDIVGHGDKFSYKKLSSWMTSFLCYSHLKIELKYFSLKR